MIIHTSLNSFWNISLQRRKYHTVGETISTKYPIKDNKEELISVSKLFKEHNIPLFYNPPEEIKNIKQDFLLRTTAAQLLLKAAKMLPKNMYLLVSEGYRPLWFQKREFDRIFSEMLAKFPKKSRHAVWEMTTMYIADPKLSPPHSSGGTLDLTICDKNGNPIDMGNPMNSVSRKSNTFTRQINTVQKENRMLLFKTLSQCDFVNIPSEWWHYSHGDQYWALFNKHPYAKYGPVDAK